MWMLHLALLQRATTAVTASAVGERHGESEAVAQLLERAPRVVWEPPLILGEPLCRQAVC